MVLAYVDGGQTEEKEDGTRNHGKEEFKTAAAIVRLCVCVCGLMGNGRRFRILDVKTNEKSGGRSLDYDRTVKEDEKRPLKVWEILKCAMNGTLGSKCGCARQRRSEINQRPEMIL